MRELYRIAQETVVKYPGLNETVTDIVQLCADEIEEGESPDHEIQLAIEAIRQNVEEYKIKRSEIKHKIYDTE